jgi:hypothetical protein
MSHRLAGSSLAQGLRGTRRRACMPHTRCHQAPRATEALRRALLSGAQPVAPAESSHEYELALRGLQLAVRSRDKRRCLGLSLPACRGPYLWVMIRAARHIFRGAGRRSSCVWEKGGPKHRGSNPVLEI